MICPPGCCLVTLGTTAGTVAEDERIPQSRWILRVDNGGPVGKESEINGKARSSARAAGSVEVFSDGPRLGFYVAERPQWRGHECCRGDIERLHGHPGLH